jgi:hypothetical protein
MRIIWHFSRIVVLGVVVSLAATGLGQDRMDAAILAKVKKATVALRVTLPGSRTVYGSGFFGAEPGIVLTNAHVLGMPRPDCRKPVRIDVVVRSGQKDEETVPGEVLGVDGNSDLAVVRVQGKNLPEPLSMASAKDLQETQEVFVFGFPLGNQLGKDITVNKSSVSSLRKNDLGIIRQVQLNGGLHAGNSGGPVVDGKGRVVGVGVSGLANTQIHFAVPGDYVHTILNGRLVGLVLDLPYVSGEELKVPVELRLLDPLQRIRKVTLDYWIGDDGKRRPPSLAEPKPLPGDSTRQSLTLTHRAGLARGELTLPKLPAGKVYWTQPIVVNGAGETAWAAATVAPLAPPLERKPLVLAAKRRALSALTITYASALRLLQSKGEEHALAVELNASMMQKIDQRTFDQDVADARLEYTTFELKMALDRKPVGAMDEWKALAKDIGLMAAAARLDKQGNLVQRKADLSKLPEQHHKLAGPINDQVLEYLGILAIPLPGKEVAVSDVWKSQQGFSIRTMEGAEEALADITYKYLGTRTSSGRQHGVIALAGTTRGRKGDGQNLSGRLEGLARYDAETGCVVEAELTLWMDMDTSVDGRSTRAIGTIEIRSKRKVLSAGAKE